MFYLTKFCRICVKPSNRLLELNRQDFDLITFGEKLQVCTKMVVGKEDLSTMICASCIKKLRISYDFQDMCMKSNGVLRGYLTQLIGTQEKFENADLRVVVSPIPQVTLKIEMDKFNSSISNKENNSANVEVPNNVHNNQHESIDVKTDITSILLQSPNFANRIATPCKTKEVSCSKRKRVSKDQRCSLLRKFLSNVGPKGNKTYSPSRKFMHHPPYAELKKKGGLKELLCFIKGYDFGYDMKSTIEQFQETPLDKLENFSKTFFYSDFTAYRNTILSVIHSNETEMSDDDDMFNPYDEEEDRRLWFGNIKQEVLDEQNEHVFIEPGALWGIKEEPKMETVYMEPDIHIKKELIDENDEEGNEYLPSELVQACYNEETSQHSKSRLEHNQNETFSGNYKYGANSLPTLNNNFPGCYPSTSGMPSSIEMLQRFTNWAKRGGRKVISPNSLKCRTRGRPFINPQLMEQFKSRSFKCDKCHRSFKSLGYLQSHCTKMGH